MTKDQTTAIQFVLGQLRMAYDLRNRGDIAAREYERSARRALAELIGVPYDTLREEGTRPEEVAPSVSFDTLDAWIPLLQNSQGGAA